jgi:hypothetical protein
MTINAILHGTLENTLRQGAQPIVTLPVMPNYGSIDRGGLRTEGANLSHTGVDVL